MGDEIFKEIALKGYDPRDFTIFSYGGGGPLHACGYAEALKVGRVVVPPNSQVFSASGAAGLQLLRIYEQSAWFVLFNPLTKQLFSDFDTFNGIVEGFEERARGDFAEEGYAPDELSFSLELDMRSSGQLYVITVASPVDRIRDEDDLARHVDYIHINPVKHRLVERVVDWRWSTFHRYERLGILPADWAAEPSVEGAFGE